MFKPRNCSRCTALYYQDRIPKCLAGKVNHLPILVQWGYLSPMPMEKCPKPITNTELNNILRKRASKKRIQLKKLDPRNVASALKIKSEIKMILSRMI